jgi:cytochrome b6-f complex iron-sulfur subunit
MLKGGTEAPSAVQELRAKPLEELPPDARQQKVLEAAKEEKAVDETSRRAFLSAAGMGWIAFAAANGVGALATQRFMFPNVLEEPNPQVRVGPLANYANMAVGDVNEDFKSQGIWLIRLDGAVAALSIICTHLGCIPNWLASERKFKCPCHGSGFMQTGVNFEGPAPRPLERFKLAVEDGVLVVDRSKKFQEEKGEWASPESFVAV